MVSSGHFHSLREIGIGFSLQGVRGCCTEGMWKTQRENKLTNQRLVWEGMNSSSPAEVRERGSSSQAVTGNATATSRGPQVVLTQCIQPLVPALHGGLEADPQSVLSAELPLCFSAAQPPRISGIWASPGLCSGLRRPDHSARNSGVRELHSSPTEHCLLTSQIFRVNS